MPFIESTEHLVFSLETDTLRVIQISPNPYDQGDAVSQMI
jgi:hypothetical protein